MSQPKPLPFDIKITALRRALAEAAAGPHAECEKHLKELRRESKRAGDVPLQWTGRSRVRYRELEVGFVKPDGTKEVIVHCTKAALDIGDILHTQDLAHRAGAKTIFVQGGFDFVRDTFDPDSDYDMSDAGYAVEIHAEEPNLFPKAETDVFPKLDKCSRAELIGGPCDDPFCDEHAAETNPPPRMDAGERATLDDDARQVAKAAHDDSEEYNAFRLTRALLDRPAAHANSRVVVLTPTGEFPIQHLGIADGRIVLVAGAAASIPESHRRVINLLRVWAATGETWDGLPVHLSELGVMIQTALKYVGPNEVPPENKPDLRIVEDPLGAVVRAVVSPRLQDAVWMGIAHGLDQWRHTVPWRPPLALMSAKLVVRCQNIADAGRRLAAHREEFDTAAIAIQQAIVGCPTVGDALEAILRGVEDRYSSPLTDMFTPGEIEIRKALQELVFAEKASRTPGAPPVVSRDELLQAAETLVGDNKEDR